jgi:V/A-type H+-transporting ATPase subunit F
MSGYKIAVIGDKDSVIGFKALGLEVIDVNTPAEAKEAFAGLLRSKDEYAIIYITEQLADKLSDEISAAKDKVTPAVILIPSKSGTLGMGMSALKMAVERAIGSDILQ